MPWTDFTCPDGFGIRIEDCLKKCRMDCGRCVSKPTLLAMAAGGLAMAWPLRRAGLANPWMLGPCGLAIGLAAQPKFQ